MDFEPTGKRSSKEFMKVCTIDHARGSKNCPSACLRKEFLHIDKVLLPTSSCPVYTWYLPRLMAERGAQNDKKGLSDLMVS